MTTLKQNDSISHVISKSTKPRNGGHWKQIVTLTPFGKTAKGKTAYVSQTKHVPA